MQTSAKVIEIEQITKYVCDYFTLKINFLFDFRNINENRSPNEYIISCGRILRPQKHFKTSCSYTF